MATYELLPHPEFGFLQISPTPTAEEISQFYAEEFYSAYPGFNDSAVDIQVADRDWLNERRNEIFDSFAEFIDSDISSLNLLDIGCGWGEALLYFQNRGLQCYGFDPVPEAIHHAKKQGLEVVVSGMDTMNPFAPTRFELVTMFNVLEHLADPVATLLEIKKHTLADNGILYIDVPNEFNSFQTCANDVHNLNEWWVIPPGHLNYFNKGSLQALLEGLGYEVLLAESSFPMELFLLFGDNYVDDGKLGGHCHLKRTNFEHYLRSTGRGDVLRSFYQNLAELNLGRQITMFARPKSS